MIDMIIRTFVPEDEAGVNKVIQRAFNNPSANAYPFPPDGFIVVAEQDQRIVGHISIRPMRFHAGNWILDGNVLHMVATDPDFQHKGIGHAMLDKVIEISRKAGMVFSFLETPIPEFYARKGWEDITSRKTAKIERITVDQNLDGYPTPISGIKIADGRREHVQDYVGLRTRYGQDRWLFSASTSAYMNELLDFHVNGGLTRFFHEISKDDEIIGYLFGERAASAKVGEPLDIIVREWIMDESKINLETEILAILDYLLDFDDEFDQVVIIFLGSGRLDECISKLGTVSYASGGNFKDMARLIDREALSSLMQIKIPQSVKHLLKGKKVHLNYNSRLFQSHFKD